MHFTCSCWTQLLHSFMAWKAGHSVQTYFLSFSFLSPEIKKIRLASIQARPHFLKEEKGWINWHKSCVPPFHTVQFNHVVAQQFGKMASQDIFSANAAVNFSWSVHTSHISSVLFASFSYKLDSSRTQLVLISLSYNYKPCSTWIQLVGWCKFMYNTAYIAVYDASLASWKQG